MVRLNGATYTAETSCARLACAVKRDVTSPIVPVVDGQGGRRPLAACP